MPIDRETFDACDKRGSIEDDIIRFLNDNPEKAYNVHEVTAEVIDADRSEATVDEYDLEELEGRILDLAAVRTQLDALVDNGALDRCVADTVEGKRSYYMTPRTER